VLEDPMVYLIGAGPGRKELLTLRAAELLKEAEVVVYDYLVSNSVLALASRNAVLYDVGKRPGRPTNQGDINDLLLGLSQRYSRVVRLKGGDPFIFGRGAEEAQFLQRHGVKFEIVPGVSSVNGASVFAGLPLTHRGVAQGYTVITGHGREGMPLSYDWEALVRSRLTIVVLMGVAHRLEIAESLCRFGMDPKTPAAVVTRATTASQQIIRCALCELPGLEVTSPSAIVIGEVASVDVSWLSSRPLFGLRVVVTRPSSEEDLVAPLEYLGAEVTHLPAIEIGEPSDSGAALRSALERVQEFEWLIFTSSNAVRKTFEELGDLRRLGGVKLGAIGSGTRDTLLSYKVGVDFVPTSYVGESFAEEFPKAQSKSGSVLLPRAKVARDVVPQGLMDKGWNVSVVEAYETKSVRYDSDQYLKDYDLVLFASPSAVDAYFQSFGERLNSLSIGAIGPITARKASALGLRVDFIGDVYNFEGLIDATVSWWRSRD
jgi:uroporphyrinogen III methyltransferase/synthase